MIKKILLLMLAAATSLLSARTVYVTRHGQVGDKNFYDAKIRETKITTLGSEQARLLGKYLVEKKKFAGTIYVSPLNRTIETGCIIAAMLDKKVILEPGIQEIAQGKTRPGMTIAQINERFPDMTIAGSAFNDNWRVSFEDKDARQKRVGAALERILSESDGDILLVCHGGTVLNLLKEFNRRRTPGSPQLKGIPWNCSLFAFELDAKNNVIKSSYTTEYLPDDMVTSNFRAPKVPRPDDPRYAKPGAKK